MAEILGISENELSNLAEKHGELTCLQVDDIEFWFRQPDRKLISMANSALFEKDIAKYNDIILENCILTNKEILEKSNKIRFALYKHVDVLVTDKVVTIKKFSATPK